MASLRLLTWPGMPTAEALEKAAQLTGVEVQIETASSNEEIGDRLGAGERFDVVFPSDYLVERLRDAERLAPVDRQALPLHRLERWARDAEHDPGCRYSVPFAYGTTGFLHDERFAGATSWRDLFEPPPGLRVGMLGERREVVGAALLALGGTPNDTDEEALNAARTLLERQRRAVERYDSDDFLSPVLDHVVAAHQAWSGPASTVARENPGFRFVVPSEGAVLWITTAAIPRDAAEPVAALILIRELMRPELAALTTLRDGFATPNAIARRRLPPSLREDPILFPPPEVLQRCHVARDVGPAEERIEAVWNEIVAARA